jgi:hypothetical protein
MLPFVKIFEKIFKNEDVVRKNSYICGYKGVLMRRLVRFYEDWIKDWFIDCDHKFEIRHKRGGVNEA